MFSHCNSLTTCVCDDFLQRYHETKSYGIKANEAVFFRRKNLIFCIFGSKISNLMLPLGAGGTGRRESCNTYHPQLSNCKTLKSNKKRPIHKLYHIYHPNKIVLENIMNKFK